MDFVKVSAQAISTDIQLKENVYHPVRLRACSVIILHALSTALLVFMQTRMVYAYLHVQAQPTEKTQQPSARQHV